MLYRHIFYLFCLSLFDIHSHAIEHVMSLNRLKQLIHQGEHIRLEYKEAFQSLPKNIFETICAMLNREGGDIILGIDDDGVLKGLSSLSSVEKQITDIVNLSNNPQKLDPPFILYPQQHLVDGKLLIHIQVPASSQVHKTGGYIYDRSNDGDFKVTQAHQIAIIYNNKRNHYTEGNIYPNVQFNDFNPSLFYKIRNLIKSNYPNHPWLALDNEQLLVKAGLWRQDKQYNQEGYTLAAILLLGKDEVIQSTVPHYKIDALLRIKNTLRYDDRDYIQTNLIDAYDRLMDFVAKHLPDKFYMEGDQRVSLRDKIFREVIGNLIVHREYTNALPCTFVIHQDRVESQNANNPHGEGLIDPNNFAPFPKNPAIAKFFMQLGRVDELGSCVLNVGRLLSKYVNGSHAKFIEGTTFRIIIPLTEEPLAVSDVTENYFKEKEKAESTKLEGNFTKATKSRLLKMVDFIQMHPGVKVADLMKHFGVSERTIKEHLRTLITSNLIHFEGSKKAGGYYTDQS